MQKQIVKTVSRLREIGIERNDRVALALPNGPEAAVAFLAIASGATCAPLNPSYRTNEFEFHLKDLEAKALVLQAGIAEPARVAAQKLNIPIIELLVIPQAAAGVFELSGKEGEISGSVDFALPEDTALILHTSGTTSRPKMVPLAHHSLYASAHSVKKALALSDRDCCLNVMPLFHIHGLVGVLLSSIASGASVVCTPGFYAPEFIEWLKLHRATWYSAVPTIHQQVLRHCANRQSPFDKLSIRFIRSSSAPLSRQTMLKLEQTFGVPVIEAYGMTEAAHQITSNLLPPQQRKPDSVGVAFSLDVQIMNERGQLLTVGKIGEVVIRGDSVTRGYENNFEANATAFAKG